MPKEKVKTISVKELYRFIKKSGMMGYIESEADLIRWIKALVEGKNSTLISFTFTKFDGEKLTFKIDLKNLEN